jgi:hypothetical protein
MPEGYVEVEEGGSIKQEEFDALIERQEKFCKNLYGLPGVPADKKFKKGQLEKTFKKAEEMLRRNFGKDVNKASKLEAGSYLLGKVFVGQKVSRFPQPFMGMHDMYQPYRMQVGNRITSKDWAIF